VRDRWACAGCGRQTSVTAGTIFQDTWKTEGNYNL
jgi:hypothetical protein